MKMDGGILDEGTTLPPPSRKEWGILRRSGKCFPNDPDRKEANLDRRKSASGRGRRCERRRARRPAQGGSWGTCRGAMANSQSEMGLGGFGLELRFGFSSRLIFRFRLGWVKIWIWSIPGLGLGVIPEPATTREFSITAITSAGETDWIMRPHFIIKTPQWEFAGRLCFKKSGSMRDLCGKCNGLANAGKGVARSF